MTIRVSCPNPDCGAVASVEEQSLGRRGRCKKCGHVFALARPGGEAASAMSGDASAWKRSMSASPAAGPLNLPEQFGRYRIMRLLGRGGMGAVYLGYDTKLDRQVALKIPFFNQADGPEAVQRFEREAKAAATLDHPNLCPVFDVGEVDGIHYFTMPYFEGKTLSDVIAKDKVRSEQGAVAVVRKLALAVQVAHEKGIIHRDLKPSNVLISKHHDLVIMDFGLARRDTSDDSPLTRTGLVLGTALYMAPEQAAGDINAIGPACDVYSLGVILYELLTSRRPFEGPWSLVIGLKNVINPDPPVNHRPDLSPALNAICIKAIAKDSKDRYQTMAEFAENLNAFLNAPSSTPIRTPSGTSHPTMSPESLAAQVFAGIITQEVKSLRKEKSPSQPIPARAEDTPPRFLNRARIIAAVGASAILLLSVIIYVVTDKGRIKIEVNDPKAVVKVDGEEVRINGLGEPITLRVGEHKLLVEWGDGRFPTTEDFVIRRGDNERLRVGFEPKPKLADNPPNDTLPREQPNDRPSEPLVLPSAKSIPPLIIGTGEWEVSGNELWLNHKGGHQWLLFGDPSWVDYDYIFEGMHEGGASGLTALFRNSDDDHWQRFDIGWHDFRTNGMTYNEYKKRYNPIYKNDSPVKDKMEETMREGQWYRLKVEVRGKRTRAYLDDKLLFDIDNNPIEKGRVGFYTWRRSSGKTRFRNIKVTAPDGRVLWDGPPDVRNGRVGMP